MDRYVIAFDVGGTSIKAGIVDSKLNLVDETYATYPAQSDKDSDTIINHILAIIHAQWEKISNEGCIIEGIGFGFPGPFDYQKGISYIKGLGKYDSLYGVDLGTMLRDRLTSGTVAGLADDYLILFENDATVFALGEYYQGKAKGCKRLLSITLGTGCGSTFLERGEIVQGKLGVPANGMIYNQPFKKGMIDNYISRRGILRLAAERGFDVRMNDVKELAVLARRGNSKAQEVFDEFGLMLGEALQPFISEFRPDRIIFGGRIANGSDLFRGGLEKKLSQFDLTIQITENQAKSALIGAASLVLNYTI